MRLRWFTSLLIVSFLCIPLLSVPALAYSFEDSFGTNPFPSRWFRNDPNCVDYDSVALDVIVGDVLDGVNCGPTYYHTDNPLGPALSLTELDDMHLVFSVKFTEQAGATGGFASLWGGFITTAFGDVNAASVGMLFVIDFTADCVMFGTVLFWDDLSVNQSDLSACTYVYNTFYGAEVKFIGGISNLELDARLGSSWMNMTLPQKDLTLTRVSFASEEGLVAEETVDNVIVQTGDLGYGSGSGGGGGGVGTRPALLQKGIDAAISFMFLASMILVLYGAYCVKRKRAGI